MSQISDTKEGEEDRQRSFEFQLKSWLVICIAMALVVALLGLTFWPEGVQAINSHHL